MVHYGGSAKLAAYILYDNFTDEIYSEKVGFVIDNSVGNHSLWSSSKATTVRPNRLANTATAIRLE